MISQQQTRKASYTALILIALVVGFGRWFLEATLGIAKISGILPIAYAFYYIAISLSFHLILSRIASLSERASLNSARLGLLVGLLPPIIDGLNTWLFGAPLLHYSYYLFADFSRFSPLFYAPMQGFPLGESMAVWLIIFMTVLLAMRQTKNPIRILASLAAAYVIFLFFLVLLPKGIADFFTGAEAVLNLDDKLRLNSRNATTQYHVFAHFIIIIFLQIWLMKSFRRAIWKRFFHYLPFGAMASTPFVFMGNYSLSALFVPGLVMVSFLFACMQNDLYDSNSGKDVKRDGRMAADGISYFLILLLSLMIYLYGIGNLLFFPQLIFLMLTLLYNLPETRMRYYILGGQKIEGGWGVCALWSGLVSQNVNPFQVGPLLLTILVFFGWAYLSSLKDLKDILVDRHDGRKTLIAFFQHRFGHLSRAVKIYKIQVAVLICLPVLMLLSRKPVLNAILFFGVAIIPIWITLTWAPRMLLFRYFSISISGYFVVFAYAAGY